ncbi:MAG: hypothetical protein V7603_3972 [Micromonosporaceae bacterium]
MLIGHHRATGIIGVRRRRPAPPRRPVLGLVALILFGLLATFFAWVTAEPLWLAVGHGSQGTATVVHCTGHGLDQRCRATFSADGAEFTATHVDLVGAPAERLGDGARVAARMVSPGSRLAYAGDRAGLALRWGLGLTLMLLCGLAIALATGAHRLPGRRARWYALLVSVAGPLLLMLAMLAVTR